MMNATGWTDLWRCVHTYWYYSSTLYIHACVLSSCSVYFESVTWDELVVGFQQPPGGPTYANRSVLSYHFYIPPQVLLVLQNQ